MKYRVNLVILLLTLVVSCNDSGKKYKDDKLLSVFTKTIDSVFSDTRSNAIGYIILPNSGCGGCISSAENLLKEYGKKKTPINFILTNVTSLKAVRNTFGNSIISGSNVFIDKTGLFYSKLPELDQIYPIIFYVDDHGDPIKFKYVNPDNPNTIEQFKNYIDSCTKRN